jgi:hypothetical protein
MITAIEFCDRYIEWLEMIDATINEIYYPAIRKLYCIAPQDLITPVACFTNKEHAVGFIYCTLLKMHIQLQKSQEVAS